LKITLQSTGRVFVLGAGVSASCGIPVARDILGQAVLHLGHKDGQEVKQIHRLLRLFYPAFDEDLRNYPNIEDFLNFIQVAKDFNKGFVSSKQWPPEELKRVDLTTLKALTDYIWSLMADATKQRAVDNFVRNNLRRGDTGITFNWDLTIERALESYQGNPGFQYTYSRKRKEKEFSLLKPHGSVDWFEIEKVKALKSQRHVETHDKELCYYPEFHFGDDPELAEISPVIVPPITSKKFRYKFLHRTWVGVLQAVTDATELHVIGYSLPKEDQFARFVFRRAIRNNMTKSDKDKKPEMKLFVVNPDETVEQTFYRLVGRRFKHFHFYQTRFEDLADNYNEVVKRA
jgi:hypothetical protein